MPVASFGGDGLEFTAGSETTMSDLCRSIMAFMTIDIDLDKSDRDAKVLNIFYQFQALCDMQGSYGLNKMKVCLGVQTKIFGTFFVTF